MIKETRNQKYERLKKEKGFRKVTVWLPEHAIADHNDMCDTICTEHESPEGRQLIPYMCRDLKTGKMCRP